MPVRIILLAVCVCMVTACQRQEQQAAERAAHDAAQASKQAALEKDRAELDAGKSKLPAVAEEPTKTERQEGGDEELKRETVVLDAQRTYRLEVESLDPTLNVAFAKQWSFTDEIPDELLAGIKEHSDLKMSDFPFLPVGKKNAQADSGYIRWPSSDTEGLQADAILWFVNGDDRKAVVISVDLPLDHTLGQSGPPLELAFDPLHLTIDLKAPKSLAVRWDDAKLPDESDKSTAIDVEASLQVTVIGRLTDESSKSIRLANHLLSEDFTQKLGGMGRIDLSNESHHGISLGWAGHERLGHSLLFGSGKSSEAIAFRYRVSGASFPLELVSRQLSDSGWPMLLRGQEYVGSTEDGVPVFRPVEYLLSKRPVKEPPSKKEKQ